MHSVNNGRDEQEIDERHMVCCGRCLSQTPLKIENFGNKYTEVHLNLHCTNSAICFSVFLLLYRAGRLT